MSRGTEASARDSLESLAVSASELASNLSADDDWMSQVNAASLLALSDLARGTASSRNAYISSERPDPEEFRAPLLAAVGAADVALQRVTDIVAALGQFLDEARMVVGTRFDAGFVHVSKLPDAISPPRIGAIIQAAYDDLILRGEATLERIGAPDAVGPSVEAGRLRHRPSSRQDSAFALGAQKSSQQSPASLTKAAKAPAKKAVAKKVAARRATKVSAARRRVQHK
jgi:heparin binding hemagglutinin HbhA